MDKKCVILVLPENEYFRRNGYDELKEVFLCIKTKYLKNGYHFLLAKCLETNEPHSHSKNIEADIRFLQSASYFSEGDRNLEMNYEPNQIKIECFERIVICGFHGQNYVYKFKKDIEDINANVFIDEDLIETFCVNKEQEDDCLDKE